MSRYVALYCRISRDKSGRVEGVTAQEGWGRSYATDAWPDLAVKVFADNDISAANGDHRPGYEALREAVSRGEIAHLWAVEQSRLERTEVGWFKLAAELDAAGITELHTNRDGVVRVRDEVAGIKAVLAAGEVRKLKRRVNDRLDEIAVAGRPSGASPFGYRRGVDEDGGKTLHIAPAEAAVIRETAARILAGWSLSRIAADLRGRGVVGAHGGRIAETTVRQMVTNHAVAGWRVHRGRTVGRGVWQPILDDDTWNAVRDKLSAPRAVERVDGTTYPVTERVASIGTARRYLLTGGTAVCGVCEAPLIASMKQLSRKLADGSRVLWKVAPYYSCHPRTGGKGCVGIMGEPFEEHVVAKLLAELDTPAFREALAEDEHAARRDEIAAALRTVERKRNRLAADWARADDDELSAEEWRIARQELAERERALRADLAAVPPPVSQVDPTLIVEGWDAMNLDERREIIGMFIERVIVQRAKPGTRGFDENRIGADGIVWRRR